MLLTSVTNEKRFLEALGAEKGRDPAWPLPNMKQISEADFWSEIACWGIRGGFGHCPSYLLGETFYNLMIFFMDVMSLQNGGLAVRYKYSGWEPDKGKMAEVQYFRWVACAHEYKQKNIGNCLNEFTCIKCGETHEVDSSG